MKKQTKAALATVFGLALTGVGTGYGFLINGLDHSHEQDALEENPAVFFLPTVPSVVIAILLVVLFIFTVVFIILAATADSHGGPAPDISNAEASAELSSGSTANEARAETKTPPSPTRTRVGRVVTSHLWHDHDGMRAHLMRDGRLRVVWISNGAHAGWLYPNNVGEWDVTNIDLEEIGSAPTKADGMELIKRYLLDQTSR